MFKRIQMRKAGITLPDLLAFGFLLGAFVAVVVVGRNWAAPASALPPIDLSLSSLPYAFFLSLSRIVLAYVVCLVSSLAVGYWAAHSKLAEMIIVPLIDIGQSVPVLAFLPGLAVTFMALFPESRTGLEITAILTLYTGMAWNLMLAFYGSIKTIPREYVDTIRAYGYGPLGILLRLELPYSMNAIVWNSMMSVAGGWFFLTVCESFVLGDKAVSLVGLGSFMKLATDRGDYLAVAAGVTLMVVVLVVTDYFVWNPLLRWAERFQRMIPEGGTAGEDEAVINFFAKSKRITNFLRKLRRRYAVKFYVTQRRGRRSHDYSPQVRALGYTCLALAFLLAVWGTVTAVRMIGDIPRSEWTGIMIGGAWTLLRVVAVVVLSGIMMVPLGLWLGTHPKLVKRLQPVIQVIAAFPAPMIFPLFVVIFVKLSIPLNIGSVFLMMLGAQWYLLFNVISGAASIPANLVEVARTTGMKGFEIMRRVYLPGTFSYIVTGLITAAGGAWNTCIVAEYVVFRKEVYEARGLGAYITRASEGARNAELMAAVTIMILLIVVVNRSFWAKLYHLAESKYRLDG
ncbi:MAG TPA: ABC transporter permease subunit [Bdellovibrionota bacterium]|jgi:NitT/TauT family transport system permease protein